MKLNFWQWLGLILFVVFGAWYVYDKYIAAPKPKADPGKNPPAVVVPGPTPPPTSSQPAATKPVDSQPATLPVP